MSLINVENLTFSYDGSPDCIFENVSFHIDTDWKLGFTGRNGRGKTTFLKLLMGCYEYQGRISSNVSFEYFPFEIEDPEEMTLYIAEGICPAMEQWELIKELNLLNMDAEVLYRPFCTLSNGERTKLMLAVLFLKENSFLLIDEPTNHLDTEGRKIVSRYLDRKKGFILVSHDRVFLDSCIDHILSINRTDIVIEKGNYSSWEYNKNLRDSFEMSQNNKLKREIKSLEEAAARASVWSNKTEKGKIGKQKSGLKADKGFVGHKAAKMMSRSKAMEKRSLNAIEEKSKLLKNIETSESLKIPCLKFHTSRLVTAENVSVYYGEKNVCGGISFTVEQGERVLLSGVNGSGKSSILKLICGGDIPHTGKLMINRQLKISYVRQDFSELSGNLSDHAADSGIDESLFKAILRKLGFSRDQFSKDMENFSGGQKKKVLIAASLCTPAHLYIWDEPLNFIDINSRLQIEELIKSFAPTMIFVEHDIAFQREIATKTVEIKRSM